MNDMTVYQSSMLMALRIAIKDQEKCEKDAGYTGDSGFLAELRETFKHIQGGGQIRILPSDF